jgi:PAX-interacting protein 1
MPTYDPNQIANLVAQTGGDHQQAAQQLQQMGGQIDPQQHADQLQQMGIDPQKLQSGGYQQHLDAQNHPDFQGYQSGDMSGQTPQFGSGQGSQSGQNFQQFDQSQGGMRGMEPDSGQQMSGDQQMSGQQTPGQQTSGQQTSGQQDYSDQQDQ